MKLWKNFTASLRDLLVPLLAVLFGLLVGALAMLWVGKNPLLAYSYLVEGVFGSVYGFGETLVDTIPLIFTGLAVAFAFRCGLFNIGVEGQYMFATLIVAYVGVKWTWLPTPIHLVVTIVAGALAGGLWAGIPGVLKATRGVHEVINSIMLNYIALYVVNYFVAGAFKAPNMQATPAVAPGIVLPKILPPSRAHAGIFIAVLAAVVVYWLLWRTTLGFQIRAVGHNLFAAEYAGISVPKNIVLAMVISGVLSGLAGASQILGLSTRTFQYFGFPGFGFNGIAVALIGRNHPAGVVLGAFLFGILGRGSVTMQAADVPKQIIAIVQASIIFFVAADEIIRWLLSRYRKEVVSRG
ncbi:MAG: ABC transporter permease [Bacillota bacterium]